MATVQRQLSRRGLRRLHRHGHLDDIAVHALDSAEHAGGWSVDASVTILAWDRHGLERLVRYCGVLAPNARLRRAVTASAGPMGATLQVFVRCAGGRHYAVEFPSQNNGTPQETPCQIKQRL